MFAQLAGDLLERYNPNPVPWQPGRGCPPGSNLLNIFSSLHRKCPCLRLYPQRQLVLSAAQFNTDGSFFGRILDGVVDQVVHQQLQQQAITQHELIFGNVCLYIVLRKTVQEILHAVVHQFAEIGFFIRDAVTTRSDLRRKGMLLQRVLRRLVSCRAVCSSRCCCCSSSLRFAWSRGSA